MEDIQYNKEDFYILGAGGFGRELESWIEKSNFSMTHELKGYIDDNLEALAGFENKFTVVDSFLKGREWKRKKILLGIASTQKKEQAYNLLLQENSTLLSFSHNFSLIGNNSNLGIGHILCPFVVVSCNVKFGVCVTVNSGSQIGHDVSIGDFVSIMANVDIGGGATIGNGVFIGSNAVILPGVNIPQNTRIGAGTVVLKSIKESGTYFGNPAKKIF